MEQRPCGAEQPQSSRDGQGVAVVVLLRPRLWNEALPVREVDRNGKRTVVVLPVRAHEFAAHKANDFNPGITESGLFWTIPIPENTRRAPST